MTIATLIYVLILIGIKYHCLIQLIIFSGFKRPLKHYWGERLTLPMIALSAIRTFVRN